MAQEKIPGRDLAKGIAFDALPDGGMLVGHVDDEQILLVRRGSEVFAVGAHCTHYHGPLVEGLVVGDTVRCPWHHACFNLRNGEAIRAPALSPITCWDVDQRLSAPMLAALRAQAGIVVGDNEPYNLDPNEDYSVPLHATRRGLAHLMIEFRQDEIADKAGQQRWAKLFGDCLEQVLSR